jgi:hypothetical protein
MASCNFCKQEYWLDYKNGGAKLELDRKTPHRCDGAHTIAITQVEREKKIEELALLKIDALNAIAAAIHE